MITIYDMCNTTFDEKKTPADKQRAGDQQDLRGLSVEPALQVRGEEQATVDKTRGFPQWEIASLLDTMD